VEPLEILRLALLVTHIVGLSAIIGSFILQMPHRTGLDFSAMLVGSIVQLASGFALIAVRKVTDLPVIDEKMGVKLVLAVLVLVAVLVGRRGGGRSRALFFAAGVTAIVNVVVAVFWR